MLGVLASIATVYPVSCAQCPVSCVWKKIRVTVPPNSKHYRFYVTLIHKIYLARIEAHRTSHWYLMRFTIIGQTQTCTNRISHLSLAAQPVSGWRVAHPLVQIRLYSMIVNCIKRQQDMWFAYGTLTTAVVQWT